MSSEPTIVQKSPTPVLVTDFDGTITERDFFRLAFNLVPPGTEKYWEEFQAGRMTHFEALRQIFMRIRGDESVVMDTARRMGIDPKLPAALTRLRQAGWDVVVASAGCYWYISRLLDELGVAVTVHANPGSYARECGLAMTLPLGSPYLDESTGISKEAVTLDMTQKHDCVAFAGDGKPDLPAAMLVPPNRRFARGWLAKKLQADGIPFRPFSCWSEIAEMLMEGVC